MSALRNFSTKRTPQSEPIPGSGQVQNNAGGYVYEIEPLQRLRRFLILGTDRGTYYQDESTLTRENAEFVYNWLAEDSTLGTSEVATMIVDEVVEISKSGRAPSNDQALFVLAMCASFGSPEGKRYAMSKLPEVARIGTHLFHFVQYMTQFRGWGRVARDGVGRWYTSRSPLALAQDVTKYRQRDGWSHRDILRLAHPTPVSASHGEVMRYAVSGERSMAGFDDLDMDTVAYLAAVEDIKRQDSVKGVVDLITEYRLPREVIPIEHLNSPEVWQALLDARMPMTALIRNLGKLTQVGVLKPLSGNVAIVESQLTDLEALKRARVHPIAILNALLTYQQGRGMRGSLTWQPVQQIVDALDRAFYLSFGAVMPLQRRVMLALDISASMQAATSMSPWLDCRTAAAAMALVTANVEPQHLFAGFTSGGADAFAVRQEPWGRFGCAISELAISPRQRLDDVVRYMGRQPHGGTDCALPMLYALKRDLEVDLFVVYTDNETWAGGVHPSQALAEYRKHTGIPARLAVVAMTATPFSIADPRDSGMLDVVGFDTATPEILSMFGRGDL